MSESSIFRRHRDFFWALIPSVLVGYLSFQEILTVASISPMYFITIFFGITAAILTLFIIYQRYEEVIAETKNQGKRKFIKAVFMYPFFSSIIGIIFVVITEIIQFDIVSSLSSDVFQMLIVVREMFLVFIVFYSLLSFAEAVSFVYRVIEGQAT